MRFHTIAFMASMIGSAPLGVAAQGYEIGQREYLNSCAQCHGAAGKGDGVIAGYLTQAVPDITTLQRDNGGVFPFARLFDVVSGTAEVGAHGTGDMPAWGDRYSAIAPQMLGEMNAPADTEAFVRGRILALLEYISTLQEE